MKHNKPQLIKTNYNKNKNNNEQSSNTVRKIRRTEI